VTQLRRGGRAPAWCMSLLIGLTLLADVRARDAADEPLEYQVKAAFLLNFTKFIEWPPAAFGAADSPIAICVLGDDPFGNALDQVVAGEVVNGRKVVVQRIKKALPPQSCQVLFFSRTENPLNTLPGVGPGVLTIGEGEHFTRAGGMIAFVLENRRVRFGINETAAEAAGLKLSSKLLNVARFVQK
jgi:YfiR/HmsC-like